MPTPTKPRLSSGKVYRTNDLSRWNTNPSRMAQRLVREGELTYLTKGLYYRPRQSRFGEVPPKREELLRAFLHNNRFLITGPELWTELGLGATAVFPYVLAYNTKRSGYFNLGGRTYYLRRIPFPANPSAEWFIVDLIEHYDMAGVSLDVIEKNLGKALRANRFNKELLSQMGANYGKMRTRSLIEQTINDSDEIR